MNLTHPISLFTPKVVLQACSRSLTYTELLYNLLSRVETCVLGILIATNTPPPLYYPIDVVAFARARYSHVHRISVPDLPRRSEELRALSRALRGKIETSFEERRAFQGFAPGWRRRGAGNRDEGLWRVLRAWGEGGERVREITEMLLHGRRVVEEMEEALGVPESQREVHPLFCVTWGRSIDGEIQLLDRGSSQTRVLA